MAISALRVGCTYWDDAGGCLPLFAIARWLRPRRLLANLAAAAVAFAVSAAPWWWLPAIPLVEQDYEALAALEGKRAMTSPGRDSRRMPALSFNPEDLMYAQPLLMQTQLRHSSHARPGSPTCS